MKVPLTNPISVKERVTRQVQEANILSFNDNPDQRLVACNFTVGSEQRHAVLWEGDAYTAIGQYTDAQICARLDEILATE